MISSTRNGESSRIASILAAGKFTCIRCGKEKGTDDFPNRKGRRRFSWCNDCYAEVDEARRLFCSYGLTVSERNLLLAFQENKCAICGRAPKTRGLSIDHEHATGRLRGGLCHLCNRLLGLARDSIEFLGRAIQYLKDPPAPRALGQERYGKIGRINTKGSTVKPSSGPLLYRCGCTGKTKCCKVHKQPAAKGETI